MKTNKPFKHLLFYWALSMVLITLPFPKYSLNSQSIILLFVTWMFYNSFSEKVTNLKTNLKAFILMSSFFWLSLVGLVFINENNEATAKIVDNLPFLIIPLVLLSIKLDDQSKRFLLKFFSFSVIIASVYALFKAMFFRINNLGDFFYYRDFSLLLDVHTTYFALFVTVAILFFFYDFKVFKTLKKWQNVTCILFLLIMLYVISSRISIVALGAIFVIHIITNFKKKPVEYKIRAVFLMLALLILYFSSPNFQARSNETSDFGTELPSLDFRLIHWNAVLNTIYKENFLFGDLKGKANETLYEEYKKLQFESGFRYKYNAHNQYLESVLNFGIIGLIFLMAMILYGFKQSLLTNNILAFTLISIFSIFMMTESILERQRGIVSFVFFLTIIFCTENKIIDKTSREK